MTANQQFVLALAVLVIPVIGSYANLRAIKKNTAITETTHTAVNSRLDQLIDSLKQTSDAKLETLMQKIAELEHRLFTEGK